MGAQTPRLWWLGLMLIARTRAAASVTLLIATTFDRSFRHGVPDRSIS